MNKTTIETAVIGCGVQGQLHTAALSRLDGVSLRALCDVDGSMLRSVQERFAVPQGYRHWKELLERETVDLVCVCTMPNTHHAVALDALAAGAHVLCEKPFAMNLAEAEEIVVVARSKGRLLSVGFNMRFMEASVRAAEAIADGKIGTPLSAHASLLCGVPRYGAHFVKSIAGGGILAGSGPHMIDLVRWLTGQPMPVAASAYVHSGFSREELDGAADCAEVQSWDGENLVDAQVRFANGIYLSVRAEARLDRRGVEYRFEVRGDEGRIVFDPFDPNVPGTPTSGSNADPLEAVNFALRRSVERELEDVVGAVRDCRPPFVAADEALVVQAVVDALYKSADTRREVRFDAPGTAEGNPRGGLGGDARIT